MGPRVAGLPTPGRAPPSTPEVSRGESIFKGFKTDDLASVATLPEHRRFPLALCKDGHCIPVQDNLPHSRHRLWVFTEIFCVCRECSGCWGYSSRLRPCAAHTCKEHPSGNPPPSLHADCQDFSALNLHVPTSDNGSDSD